MIENAEIVSMYGPLDIEPFPGLLSLPGLGEEAFEALVDSIRIKGILKPITLSREGKIVDGLHRWRAAKILELPQIPCVTTDRDAMEFALESAVTGRRLTRSGSILWLWEQHPLLAEDSKERGFSNLKKGQNPRSDYSHSGENGAFSRSYASLAKQYRLPEKYFSKLSQVRDACRTDKEWEWVRTQVLFHELSWSRAPSALAGYQAGEVNEDGEVKRAPTNHFAVLTRSFTSLSESFRQWDSLKPDQRADLRDKWNEVRNVLPKELNY